MAATGVASVPVGSEPTGWRHARLIPTYGTRTQQEQEKRATSCLLAVMHGVPEFGYALLNELGAPKSPVIETFAEVRFKDSAGKTVIPDGAIICRRGEQDLDVLVEVKTGSAQLNDDQVASYLDIARENGFDGVLTISTQITATSAESPVSSTDASCARRDYGTSRGGGFSPRQSCSSATAASPTRTRSGCFAS